MNRQGHNKANCSVYQPQPLEREAYGERNRGTKPLLQLLQVSDADFIEISNFQAHAVCHGGVADMEVATRDVLAAFSTNKARAVQYQVDIADPGKYSAATTSASSSGVESLRGSSRSTTVKWLVCQEHSSHAKPSPKRATSPTSLGSLDTAVHRVSSIQICKVVCPSPRVIDRLGTRCPAA
jgi:hypothetical protein